MARINYKEILQQKKNEKFGLLNEIYSNDYTCNHSPGMDGCIACTHPNTCIFGKEHIEYVEKISPLKEKQKKLQEYLKDKFYNDEKDKIQFELFKINKQIKDIKKHGRC